MRKIFNFQFSIFKVILLVIIGIFLLAKVSNAEESYPISNYTDFKVISKSSQQIDVKVTNDFYANPEIKNRLVDEFNLTQSPYLYQSRLIAIPDDENINLIIKHIDSIIIPAESPVAISENTNDLPIAFLGNPGIMRDIKVAPLAIRQSRYDETTNNIVCYKNIEVEIKFPTPPRLAVNNNLISRSWDDLYKNTIINYDKNNFGISNFGMPQGYLMIVADALYDSILPLVRWKELKGYTVTVKKISEIGAGTNYTAIRNYIRQAYETFSPRLDYVLIVGTHSLISGYPIAMTPNVGDHLYSCVAGDDLYPDLFIGRLPALNVSELRVMVAKILGYERTPYLTDTLWYRNGLVAGTQYSTGQPVWTALATCRWVRNQMLEHGFRRVDTVLDPPYSSGVGIIDTIVNRGVSLISGRGWGNSDGWHRPQFYKENVNTLLSNGWKLPVITSFYCGTGNYANPNRCFGEVWLLAGTPTNPKGAVAFYGPTYLNTSTRFNNCQNYGVYWGIFDENITNCGPAMFRGKLEMLSNFPLPADSQYLRIHVCTYNLLGDPSLQIWTGQVPKPLIVNHPATIPVGTSTFTISITDNVGQPVSDVLVALNKTGEIKMSTMTDNFGNATFNFSAQTPDTLFITATKPGYIPYLANISVTQQEYVGYYSYSGTTIAGQTANLLISLKNYGTGQSASNTIAILRTQDINVTMIDSIKSYGTLSPGQIVSAGPFQFTIATNCTNNHRINFQLSISNASNNYQAGFSVLVQAPALRYLNHKINDNNNQILEPGESANLLVKIINRGQININNVTGILRSTSPNAIRVLDSLGTFGTILVGDSVQNNSDYFIIQASPSVAIGRKFYCQLILQNQTGFQRIIQFPILIGVLSSTAVLGPDNYGYWAYDNTDIAYTEHPTYNWVEIDPNFGGQGTQIPMTYNSIKVINLPWTFRYYGRNYTKISVCSKGYIAMDSSWIIDQYNWHIPSPFGPPAMIATFWDDFRPDTLGASGIYYFHDATNQRFIVEWSRVRHIHGYRDPAIAELQTFQVILYNPVFYPTRTGDGPIIFQYHTVFNDDSLSSDCHNYATVGIENFDHTDGIEYTFAGTYPITAAEITAGRAIKFTTNLPDTFTSIIEMSNVKCQMSNVNLKVSPNPFGTKTVISYAIPLSSHVNLNIYDVTGKLIKNLINEHKEIGNYQIQLNKGSIPAGVYFVILTVEPRTNFPSGEENSINKSVEPKQSDKLVRGEQSKSVIKQHAKIILY